MLRYFNAAGAWGCHGEHHEPESHLIPLILQVALGTRRAISIFSTDYPTPDGTCIRDYIYNLGNDKGFSVREVIQAARDIIGHAIPVQEAARRRGDPPILVAISEKIRRELRWRPDYPSIDNIVRSAWDWHRVHPQGYGKI